MVTFDLPIGTRLAGPALTYTITRVLGRGGFGITYLATAEIVVGNIPCTVQFAIKEYFLSGYSSRKSDGSVEFAAQGAEIVGQTRSAFLRESRRLQELSITHPNIVRINEVFEANNTAYYVMEYLGDDHLLTHINRVGPMSVADMTAIMQPVVDAVAMLHRNNVAHYDIKPENIMLAPRADGSLRPVLIDFGLAKHYDTTGNATSMISTAAFSQGYAPMEQYRGITSFAPKCDVYALGATIVHCLTGRKPDDAFDIDLAALRGELEPKAGAAVADAVLKAMAARAAERTADAGALAAALFGSSPTLIVGTTATPPVDKPVAAPTPDGPENLSLCAVADDGGYRYISRREWNSMTEAERDRVKGVGVVVAYSDGSYFVVDLHHSADEITYDEAVNRYGERLPSKKQAELMAGQYGAINEAIRAYGGDDDPAEWYWTADASGDKDAWVLYMGAGTVYDYTRSALQRVRPLVPLEEASAPADEDDEEDYDYDNYYDEEPQWSLDFKAKLRRKFRPFDVMAIDHYDYSKRYFFTFDEWEKMIENHDDDYIRAVGVVVCGLGEYMAVHLDIWDSSDHPARDIVSTDNQRTVLSMYEGKIEELYNRACEMNNYHYGSFPDLKKVHKLEASDADFFTIVDYQPGYLYLTRNGYDDPMSADFWFEQYTWEERRKFELRGFIIGDFIVKLPISEDRYDANEIRSKRATKFKNVLTYNQANKLCRQYRRLDKVRKYIYMHDCYWSRPDDDSNQYSYNIAKGQVEWDYAGEPMRVLECLAPIPKNWTDGPIYDPRTGGGII